MTIANRLLAILATIILAKTTSAQSLPLDPAVITGKLPNGFTYFIRHNAEPQNRVTIYLVNKVGSMQESDKQRGLAHFMEHMSFNGTKHFPKNDLVNYLQQSGVRFGADLNAYTGFTETVYQLPLPSDDTTILRNGLQIIRDWAADATLAIDDINAERGVVLEEKRLRNGASQRMQDKIFPLQVNNSRFAGRLPIGTDSVLNNFSFETLNAFNKDWYRPDLQAIIIVGDIDVLKMKQQVVRMFSDLRPRGKKTPLTHYTIPLTGSNQFMAVTDPEESRTIIEVMIKHRDISFHTANDYRVRMLRNFCNYYLGSRIAELAAMPDPPFIQAQAGIGSSIGDINAFSVTIIPKPARLKDAFEVIWTEIERLRQSGMPAAVLQRAKTAYMQSLEDALAEKQGTPSQSLVSEYVEYFLNGTASPGIDYEYKLAARLASGITLKDVNDYAKSMVKTTNRDVYITAPETEKQSLPSFEMVSQWMKTIGQRSLPIISEAKTAAVLIPVLPESGTVVSRTYIDSIAATCYTLSNGVRVWVKTTGFMANEIFFGAISKGGSAQYNDSLYNNAAASVDLVTAGGLGSFTPVELDKILTGKSLQVQPFIDENTEGINGVSTNADLEAALQLTYLYFTAPRKDTALFRNLVDQARAGFAFRSNNPEAVYNDTLNMLLGGYHYRRLPPSVKRVDSLDLDVALGVYRERFLNAADFQIVFTGSIDSSVFLPLIEKYIGSLPADTSRELFVDRGIHIPSGKITKSVVKGNDDKSTVNLFYPGDYLYNETNNVQLLALAAVLQYRITDRIREAEGGAYSPAVSVDFSKNPHNEFLLNISFGCAPVNVERLIQAAGEEVARLKNNGATKEEIEKFYAEKSRQIELNARSNQYWNQYMLRSLNEDEPMTTIPHRMALLKTVSEASVKESATTYLDDQHLIRIVLMPESKVVN